MNGQPVRLINTDAYGNSNRERKGPVELADAVATILWAWSPNAVRAFLDRNRFRTFEWTCTLSSEDDKDENMFRITRKRTSMEASLKRDQPIISHKG